MKYSKIKNVTNYKTHYYREYMFCIASSNNCYYAIIMHEDEMVTEKAMSVAIAKQILLNHLYKYIHKEAQQYKYNKEKLEEIELIKTVKTNEIVNFIY